MPTKTPRRKRGVSSIAKGGQKDADILRRRKKRGGGKSTKVRHVGGIVRG